MALVLSIDLGTTNLKVGLVSQSAKVIRSLTAPCPVNESENGACEHHPIELLSLITALVRELLSLENNPQIDYIVCSTYQFGLMLLDEHKNPISGMSLLTDIRAQKSFESFRVKYWNIDLYQKTGCPLITPYPLPRLYYLSVQETAMFRQARYFTDCKAYLFHWLTGEFVTDISSAAATQYFNLENYQWDCEILDRININISQLPEIKDGLSYFSLLRDGLSAIFGQSKNVKVLLGLYDGAALANGLNGLKTGSAVINIGTSAMIRSVSTHPIFDFSENKRIQPYAIGKNLFFNGGALNNAALPLNWLKNRLFNQDLANPDLIGRFTNPPLLCLPYLTGERDSLTGPFASGVFFGLRTHHHQIDLNRSVLEGVAYSLRYIFEALKENSLCIDKIYMGGGGIQIQAWPQIFANVLSLPIAVSPEEQMALIGNAMLCFNADGIGSVIRHTDNDPLTLFPDESRKAYHEETYQFFKKLREGLAPYFQKHMDLGNISRS